MTEKHLKEGGKLLGTQMQPRDIAAGLYEAGFKDTKVLSDAIKVCLSESQGYTRAYNDNVDGDGNVVSRDVGLMQVNIPASQIGTASETDLYEPDINFGRAHKLWEMRGFQPWVAFNTNVYLRDTYLKRANKGLANWLADLDLEQTPTDTLNSGQPYAHTLTTPVTDYMYRVTTQHQALLEARTELKKAKPSVATLRNIIYNSVDLYKS